MTDLSIQRDDPFLILFFLPAFLVLVGCSSTEPDSSTASAIAPDVTTAKYTEMRNEGKSHKAASELSSLHSAHRAARGLSTSPPGRPPDHDRTTYTDTQSTMEAAIVLARFSTNDSHEAARREQAAEELNTRLQSRELDADRALDLLDKIAPEASINERREAAKRLARLSGNWDDGNAKEAAEELARLITGNTVDSEKRIAAANELVSRSNAGDLDADNALDLMHDIAPELSINERRESAGNLVRLSKSDRWDAETTKQAAEQTFQFVTGGKLEIEKRSDAAVDLTGEAVKSFKSDSFDDEDIDTATELIKDTIKGELNTDKVSDLLNLK